MDIKYGCCLYTVRDNFAKDPYGTLYALKEMGYSYIELGEFGALSGRQWRDALLKSSLGLISVHFGINYLEAWFEHVVEFIDGLEMGTRYIGYPSLRRGKGDSPEGYKEEAVAMNKIGRKLKERGYQLIYHNHAFEFKQFDGKYGLEILFENTDPEYVQFQLDTYWVAYSGEDPAAYIRKFAGRCDIIHLKDMDKDRNFAPVGEGTLDFESIISTALNCKVKGFLVEQDDWNKPSLECALSSSKAIKKILSAL